MQIQFLGAAGEVTGSCYLLTAGRSNVLLDCGLFQGGATANLKNRRPFPFNPAELSGVILTHAHLDHTGRLPILTRAGLSCRVHCTRPTLPLTDVLLRDAAALQKQDFLRRQYKKSQRGCDPVTGAGCGPLFEEADAASLVRLLVGVPFDTDHPVAPGISVRFIDSGHIIGSASCVVTLRDGQKQRTVVFSGDIGQPGTPVIRDPIAPRVPEADAVVLESTYGDKDHKPIPETIESFAGVLTGAIQTGGKVLVPAFAVGRTQTLIYVIARLQEAGRLPKDLPVFVDTPLGIEATRIYNTDPTLFDDETRAVRAAGNAALSFRSLRFTRTGQESKGLNDLRGPAVIIAGAGMCTGGRILHHLRNRAGDPATSIVIAGFQAQGTLGRQLVELKDVPLTQRRPVRIFGQPVDVRARIVTLNGFSAHAGQSTLVEWARQCLGACTRPPRLYLTHGEQAPRLALAEKVKAATGVGAALPMFGDVAELSG
ncbi:MAG: MBL fold metallo-hydrolase [Phycisphaerales bacterium]|nr:MBL fold metallo-hydrolase [Phycisphaerales bacterium]